MTEVNLYETLQLREQKTKEGIPNTIVDRLPFVCTEPGKEALYIGRGNGAEPLKIGLSAEDLGNVQQQLTSQLQELQSMTGVNSNEDLLNIVFQLDQAQLIDDDTLKTVYIDDAIDMVVTKGTYSGGKVFI